MGKSKNTGIKDIDPSEFSASVWSLFDTIRRNDASTAGHCMRVAEYVEAYMKNMNYPKDTVDEAFYAALLHDAGKIDIPDEILKFTGMYSKEQRKIMNNHSEAGLNFLPPILKKSQMIKDAMVHHHTSYNPFPEEGGMPGGHISNLYGKDIPEIARIVAVADIFDALSAARMYKKEMTFEDVIRIVEDDVRLDPDIKKEFIPFIQQYMTEKGNIECAQVQIIGFNYNNKDRSKETEHIFDKEIETEIKKNIDTFITAEDKDKYFSPNQDELLLFNWNTTMREIIRSMPTASGNDGKVYDPLPVCDRSGRIYKVEYRSEGDGKLIGDYVFTLNDFKKTVKAIVQDQVNKQKKQWFFNGKEVDIENDTEDFNLDYDEDDGERT